MQMGFTDADRRAALGFVRNQSSHIEMQVNEAPHADLQYRDLVPIDFSASPFVKSVTYYSADMAGRAEWINGNGDDVPMASGNRTQHETSVHTAGIGYGYGWEEVNHARLLGVNLPADDAKSARRAYEEMCNRIALQGDATKGFEGLFNYTGVPTTPAENGSWDTASAAEMVADVNGALLGVYSGTNETVMANTVLLPESKYLKLASTQMPDTDMTVLAWLQRNNLYTISTGQPILIRAARGLNTAGAGGVARMVAYRRSDEVMKMHIPMEHQFLPARESGSLYFEVPGVFRLGGLDIRRKQEVRYVDGL